MRRVTPSSRVHRPVVWAMAVVMLAMSLLGALATTHEALHVLDGSAEFAHEHGHGHDNDAHPRASTDDSRFDALVHGLAHAWHCCGMTMAVLPTPVAKLLSAPPPPVPAFDARSAPAPALQGLFRPPIG